MKEQKKRNQAEKTQQLLEESKQHLESLKTKQEEISIAVISLEENLSSLKAVLQDSISKAEEDLEQPRCWQELVRKQGEFLADIQENPACLKLITERMMTKSVGKPESSPNPVTVPVFVPIAGTSLTAPEGGSDRG